MRTGGDGRVAGWRERRGRVMEMEVAVVVDEVEE